MKIRIKTTIYFNKPLSLLSNLFKVWKQGELKYSPFFYNEVLVADLLWSPNKWPSKEIMQFLSDFYFHFICCGHELLPTITTSSVSSQNKSTQPNI